MARMCPLTYKTFSVILKNNNKLRHARLELEYLTAPFSDFRQGWSGNAGRSSNPASARARGKRSQQLPPNPPGRTGGGRSGREAQAAEGLNSRGARL